MLDRLYAAQIDAARELFQTGLGQRRATTDIGEAARGATKGALELLLVDIDHALPGTVDDIDGTVLLASEPSVGSYDVIDESTGRAIVTGSRFLGVRRQDIPDGAPLAAALRHPI